MLVIYDKDGNELWQIDLLPEDLYVVFKGKLQDITLFDLKDNDNIDIELDENLKDLFYEHWWGNE